MNIFKNITQEKVVELVNEVNYQENQIVSKTLIQNEHLNITLFAFSKDEEISTHKSSGDAMITVLDGAGIVTIDGCEYQLKTGDTIVMPANKPHSVQATENFKMILVVAFPII